MTGNEFQDRNKIFQTVQQNCDISDARDNGIYSICTLILKLRNHYKWEHNLAPWDEPDSSVLLDWIEKKEKFWETIAEKPYNEFSFNNQTISYWDITRANKELSALNLFYGAGYGRSLKTIFFIAEIFSEFNVNGCPVVVLGKELARELASPFAMLQNDKIYIRRESLRCYFWDQIQEIRSSCRTSLQTGLSHYGIIKNNKIDWEKFKGQLDTIVDNEMIMFIYHEIGELQQETLDSRILKKIVSNFPSSSIEFVCRALKDILADTHPEGMLQFIIKEKRKSSLAFYVGFLDGLRKTLFPEIINAFDRFIDQGDWTVIQDACDVNRQANIIRAQKIQELVLLFDHESPQLVRSRFEQEIISPLGLDIPS